MLFILTPLICALLCLGTVFSCLKTSFARAYTATNDDTIGNIYLGGGKFDRGNLDKLAATVGYTDGISQMVTAASNFNYTAANLGFKNSTDFGDTVVKFGTYTYNNTEYELSWFPTFVSKADNNDVILTLWLADTDDKNGTVSDQEISMYSDGTHNGSAVANPSSNNYSTSYIRAVINNGGNYCGNYIDGAEQIIGTGDMDIHEIPYTTSNDNKFAQFTIGGIKDYIVTPSKVGWQRSANFFKNDPGWTASVGHYTSEWLEDKLWLPSLYEVFDNSQGANYTGGEFDENGGLWRTGDGEANRQKRSNSVLSWLRSGQSGYCDIEFILVDQGFNSTYYVHNNTCGAVRPALHLNLSKAAANSFNTIENIYDQANSKFSGENLNALAQAAKFADFKSMVQTAQNGDKKTSQDFGDTVVNFGTYTYGGVTRELTWIPAYVSEDDTGNAILTLWLAGTDSGNGILSDQEISTFTGGGYNTAEGTDPSSNNYSTSKIRVETLNSGGTYYSGYNNTGDVQTKDNLSATTYTPTNDNKFAQFTMGVLKDYIVTPNQVGWQKNSKKLNNDPEWNGDNKGHYTRTDWLNDKLWLPSTYEVFMSDVPDNYNTYAFGNADGGLWETGGATEKAKRANSTLTWLRSGRALVFHHTYILQSTGDHGDRFVHSSGAVRPALHLNLNMAATSACGGNSHISGGEWQKDGENHWKICTVCGEELDSATHGFDEGVRNPEPTCTENGVLTKTCTTCGETKTETIPFTGHTSEVIPAKDATCTETGLTEGSKCSVCQEILTAQTEVPKIPHTPEVIPAKEATCTEKGLTAGSKCSICQTVLTVQTEVPKIPHTPATDAAVAPTCTTAGKTEGSHCSVCNAVITAQTEVSALGHKLGTWQHDETNHWKICSVCNTKQENAAHGFGAWTVIKEPTATASGERSCTCTVCGYIKTETIVQDEDGNWVSGLPELQEPDSNYKLEITIKATDKVYALDGESKGYNVRLWIVNNKTDDKKEFNKEMEVTLSLIVPQGMEEFTLYRLVSGGFEEIKPEEYKVEAGVLSIRTTLPEEFIFNTTAAPAKGGIPWWVWLIVGLALVAIIVVIVIIVVKKKHAPAPETETVYVNGESYDDTELKQKMEEQNEKIDELLNREIPVDALSQTLTDDEMRSFFTDQELIDMVRQGKISQEDCDRVIKGRKK